LARALETASGLERAVGLTLSAQQRAYVDKLRREARVRRRFRVAWRIARFTSRVRPTTPSCRSARSSISRSPTTATRSAGKVSRVLSLLQKEPVEGRAAVLADDAYLNMDRRDASQFMTSEIFPNADLPYLSEIVEACEAFSRSRRSATTVSTTRARASAWLARLRERRAEAAAVSSPEIVAKFEKYLALSSVGFHQGKLCLLRMTARRRMTRPVFNPFSPSFRTNPYDSYGPLREAGRFARWECGSLRGTRRSKPFSGIGDSARR